MTFEPEPPPQAFKIFRTLRGHSGIINRLAWSPEADRLASTSYDQTVRIWDIRSQDKPLVLKGPSDRVTCVTWSPDGHVIVGGSDSRLWIWSARSGELLKEIRGHSRSVFCVAWSPDGKYLASGSQDSSINLWHITPGRPDKLKLSKTLQGHSSGIGCIAWSPNSLDLASGSEDGDIRLWDVENGRTKRILEGHTEAVYDLVWSPDGRILASASQDATIRLWRRTVGVLEGHTNGVNSLSFSTDGKFMASKSLDGSVRIWRKGSWEPVEVIPEPVSQIPVWTAGLAFHPQLPIIATLGDEGSSIRLWSYDEAKLAAVKALEESVRYTNAKVVLVGDSGVGKTALAQALLNRPSQATESTHGRKALRFSQEEFVVNGQHEIHETYLWDMAGQPSYRLIHQLHLSQVVVALVVFDVLNDLDVFAGVKFWARALKHAQKLKGDNWPLTMYLVAGRTDRGEIGVSQGRLREIVKSLGFAGFFKTSALQNWGIAELEAALRRAIPWDKLPKVSSTKLFQQIKVFLTLIRDRQNKLLFRTDELYDTFLFQIRNAGFPLENTDELRAQFETCIGLVESQALIRRFNFGNLVLLHPETLDAYASSIITTAKDEGDGDGQILEEDVINCHIKMSADERIADKADEQLLLIATIADLIRHEIALKDTDNQDRPILIFPSQSGRTPPPAPEHDTRTAIFTFDGPVMNIYVALAVRLWNGQLFRRKEVFENATFFYETGDAICCLYLRVLEEGRAELAVYVDEKVSARTYRHVSEYVHTHLLRRASPGSVTRKQLFFCPDCGTPVSETVIKKVYEQGRDWVNCQVCEKPVSIKRDDERASAQQTLLRQAMVTRVDREAEAERLRQMATSTIQGKRLTGDYDIFFCHNLADQQQVRQIALQLEGLGILPWMANQTNGDKTQEPLEVQLAKSKQMAFFVGNNNISSRQNQEFNLFSELGREIILVFLPDASRNIRFPLNLKGRPWVDFRNPGSNPLEQLVNVIIGVAAR
ncbi:MAG TPA: TIR domain-containing protein [Phototrophicaceae bacterium]|nr:TIR domain-containing protein [Phototrophicaceae bacterium]